MKRRCRVPDSVRVIVLPAWRSVGGVGCDEEWDVQGQTFCEMSRTFVESLPPKDVQLRTILRPKDAVALIQLEAALDERQGS